MIAATNKNLEKMIRDGQFREELYYRLNVVAITLPPLRDRSEDIEALVEHFLDELSSAYGRPRPAVGRKLMRFLQSYNWPGNIRQLRNCVESMFVLADSRTLTEDDLLYALPRGGGGAVGKASGGLVRFRFTPVDGPLQRGAVVPLSLSGQHVFHVGTPLPATPPTP